MPFKNPHPLYSVWQSLKRRCDNPNFRQWADYGGRGIAVCDRWNDSFQAFLEDMGPRPSGFVIDRIDNDGNYEPSNCRWVSRKTSQRNRRANVHVTIEGKTYLAVELADRIGMKTDTIVARSAAGLSLKDVLNKKTRVFAPGLALGGIASGLKKKEKTHCPQGHSYSDALISAQGWRKCRICHAERERLRRSAAPSRAMGYS